MRAFSHDHPEKNGLRLSEAIMRKEHHPIRIMLDNVQQQSGRWTGQGARDCREDGRHPKDKDHGRIAGR